MKLERFTPAACLAIWVLSTLATPAPCDDLSATGRKGMVVSSSVPASDVGRSVLEDGGNAVDAAIAVGFAMAVTYPQAGNIGGGGFMMVHPHDERPVVCVEYRETAPAAATKTMFRLGETRFGHKIVGVPGTVRGFEVAHEKYGSLPWKRLVEPAVKLARNGFQVDALLARSLNGVIADPRSRPYREFLRVFAAPDGSAWQAGQRLVQPDLAKTLQQIADQGASAFYEGAVADLLVRDMKAAGGLITKDDLANYRAKVREPVRGTYRGYDIFGPPPPSSGGICLVQMLNQLEPYQLRDAGRWSAKTLHLITEAQRRSYLDRARFLGDQDFVEIPPELITKPYANKLAASIETDRATPSSRLANAIPLSESGNSTTHFSVVDQQGMAVSNTYTLEFSYGSRVVVPGGGFLLNNEMGDFNWKPGHTDSRGRVGTLPNQIAPGKRMLSSQTPTIVARDGKPVLITGSPGGRTIINTVLCVVLNVLEFEMDPLAAIRAPRTHHQWMPDSLRYEKSDDPTYQQSLHQLGEMGHRLQVNFSQGDANTVFVGEDGLLTGVADPRRSGKAAGF